MACYLSELVTFPLETLAIIVKKNYKKVTVNQALNSLIKTRG